MRTLHTSLRAAAFLLATAPFVTSAQKAYIPQGGDDVSVLDVITNTVIGNISTPAGSGPVGVAFSPNGQRACLANYYGNSITLVDVITDEIITTVPGFNLPQNAQFSQDGSTLYVANSGGSNVMVVDMVTNTILDSIAVGGWPIGMAMTEDGGTLYVSGSGKVSVISTVSNTEVDTVAIGPSPEDLQLTPDGSALYVSDWNENYVTVINATTNEVTTVIPTGAGPGRMAIHPNGAEVFVAHSNEEFVSVINTTNNTITDSIPASYALGACLTPDGDQLYVLTPFTLGVVVISTATHAMETSFAMPFPLAIGSFINAVDLTAGISAATPVAIEAIVFPNPFSEQATIRFGEELKNANIRLIDATGRTVQEASNVRGMQWMLHRKGLASGVYTVRIMEAGSPATSARVIIE